MKSKILWIIFYMILIMTCISCVPVQEKEECIREFSFGDNVVFKIDTTRNGMVLSESSFYCDVQNVRYFDNKGVAQIEAFNNKELIKKE